MAVQRGLKNSYDCAIWCLAFGIHHLLGNRESFSWPWPSSSIWAWSAFIRKFSSPRKHLWVQNMDLGQQLRHRPPISCHPFLLQVVMRLQAHKISLASVWVFSLVHRIFKYWLIVIEQTAHNFRVGVSTSGSFSDLEISASDLPPVSVPAAGVNLIHHFLNNHFHRLDCSWRPPNLHFGFRDQWS